jgi:hypothetical protein
MYQSEKEKAASAGKQEDTIPDKNKSGEKVAKRCSVDCTYYKVRGEICPIVLDRNGDCVPDV